MAKPLRYSVDHCSQHFVQASEAEPVPQSGAVDLDAAAEVEIDWDHEVTTDECEDFFMSIFSADANAEGMGNGRETTIGGTTTTNTSIIIVFVLAVVWVLVVVPVAVLLIVRLLL